MSRRDSKERRRHPRQPVNEPVSLYWEENWNTLCVRGYCVDISTSGMGVRVDSLYQPFPNRRQVRFQIDSLKLAGTALVRHSIRRHGKMILGLEFCGGLRWNPANQMASVGRAAAAK